MIVRFAATSFSLLLLVVVDSVSAFAVVTNGYRQPQQPQSPQQPLVTRTNPRIALGSSSSIASSSSTSKRRTTTTTRRRSSTTLFMGRAAAVRAATKGKSDAKKAKVCALYGKKIIMAIKQGGSPDPNSNRQLEMVIKAAKQNSVPVDNITRAIKKASEATTGDFSESTYEAYGFGGASLVINVLTDNSNRANADIRTAVGKRQAKMAEAGSVLFMYDRKGRLEVEGVVLDEEALLEAAIEAGCEEMELEILTDDTDDTTNSLVWSDPNETGLMMAALQSLLGHTEQVKMSLSYVSKAPVECSEQDFDKNMDLIEALEDLDDVDSVEHNMSN